MYWDKLCTETQDHLRLRQGSLEIDMVDEGIAQFTKNIQESGPVNRLTTDIITRAWVELTNDLYVQKYQLINTKRRGRPVEWHQHALDMPSQRLALLALSVAFHCSGTLRVTTCGWTHACAPCRGPRPTARLGNLPCE